MNNIKYTALTIFILIFQCKINIARKFYPSWRSREGIAIFNNEIIFKSGMRPTSISTVDPILRDSNFSFEVTLIVKEQRMAIGLSFSNSPSALYMKPDYNPDLSGYISFGGAGYIYPESRLAKRGYANGDTVKMSVDWISNDCIFYVNNELAGSSKLPMNCKFVYPSLSSEGGLVKAIVNIYH